MLFFTDMQIPPQQIFIYSLHTHSSELLLFCANQIFTYTSNKQTC